MSSNNEIHLNPAGQVVLTGAASLAVNAVGHPLSTIQSCLQARQPIPWRTPCASMRLPLLGISRSFTSPIQVPFIGLFRGFNAVCAVDASAFAMAYIANDGFQKHLGPIGAIFAATAASTPSAAIGEGAMVNRQTSELSYRHRELWQRSFRVRGMAATFLRDLPWNAGIFYFTPKIEEEMERRWPQLSPWAREMLAATLTGATVGFLTTPLGGIKTVIQTSRENLTITQAIRTILDHPESSCDGPFVRSMSALRRMYNRTELRDASLRRIRSVERLFAGAISRTGYVSVTMCAAKLVYQSLPPLLPAILKKDE